MRIITKKGVGARGLTYAEVLDDVSGLLEAARTASVRSVNAIMTTTYWLVGQRIVEGEQQGKGRADYGTQLVERLAYDLTRRFGRGFGRRIWRSCAPSSSSIVRFCRQRLQNWPRRRARSRSHGHTMFAFSR